MCNTKPGLHNISEDIKFGENSLIFKLSSVNENTDVWLAGNLVKNWWNFPYNNPKLDFHNKN